MVTLNVYGVQLNIYWLKESMCKQCRPYSPSKFNQHFATIHANLGRKLNDSNRLSWNLPETVHEVKFLNVDVDFIEQLM